MRICHCFLTCKSISLYQANPNTPAFHSPKTYIKTTTLKPKQGLQVVQLSSCLIRLLKLPSTCPLLKRLLNGIQLHFTNTRADTGLVAMCVENRNLECSLITIVSISIILYISCIKDMAFPSYDVVALPFDITRPMMAFLRSGKRLRESLIIRQVWLGGSFDEYITLVKSECEWQHNSLLDSLLFSSTCYGMILLVLICILLLVSYIIKQIFPLLFLYIASHW